MTLPATTDDLLLDTEIMADAVDEVLAEMVALYFATDPTDAELATIDAALAA